MNNYIATQVLIPLMVTACVSNAATLSVSGTLRTGSHPVDGSLVSTLHFIELEVLSPGQVDIQAAMLGGNEPFRLYPLSGVPYGPLSVNPAVPNPFYLYPGLPGYPTSVIGSVPAGLYLWAITLNDSEWIYDDEGWGPLGPQDHPGVTSLYRVTISGDIRPIAYWQGKRDGTFLVTPLPEPVTGVNVLAGACLLVSQQRRRPSPTGNRK